VFVRTGVAGATKRSRSAVHWSRTSASCTAFSSATATNSAAANCTSARSAASPATRSTTTTNTWPISIHAAPLDFMVDDSERPTGRPDQSLTVDERAFSAWTQLAQRGAAVQHRLTEINYTVHSVSHIPVFLLPTRRSCHIIVSIH